MVQPPPQGLWHHPGLRQFVKFCVVGLSNLIIDKGISGFLIFKLGWNLYLANTLSFSLAVTNGFIWNSLWTFRGLGSGPRHELYVKFFAVNIVGYLLNQVLMGGVFFLLSGQLNPIKPVFVHWLIATAVAVLCVTFWNFTANKKWTFAEKPSEPA